MQLSAACSITYIAALQNIQIHNSKNYGQRAYDIT